MRIQSLGFRTDVALLQRSSSLLEEHGTHTAVRTPSNPAYFWGNFLLLAKPPEPGSFDTWLAVFEETFPDTRHRAFGVDDVDATRGDLAEFSAAGMTVDVDAVMTASRVVPPPHPNREATLRPLVSDEDWVQRIALTASVNTQYPARDFLDFATKKAAQDRAMVEAGHGLWFGAFVDGELVSGLGLFAAGDGLARFQSVETRPTARRQGLAGTLVHHASRHALSEWGVQTLVMVADPDGDAIRIYRSLGFAVSEHQLTAEQRPE